MEIILRSTLVFFFLFLVARGVGKRELSQLTAFELILLVTMGDLVQQGVTEEDMSITGAMLAVGTMAVWILVLSYTSFRFRRARPVLDGVPRVIISRGVVLDEVLRMERVTLDDVKEGARGHGITDLADVSLGVLEPDGRFSFIFDNGQPGEEGPGRHIT